VILTKVDKMGRTVIPSEIRRILEIKEGDYIEWTIENNKVIVKKKISVDKNLIRSRFEELRKKAPKCFTEEEVEEDKWMLAKLGLSE